MRSANEYASGADFGLWAHLHGFSSRFSNQRVIAWIRRFSRMYGLCGDAKLVQHAAGRKRSEAVRRTEPSRYARLVGWREIANVTGKWNGFAIQSNIFGGRTKPEFRIQES